MGLHQARDGGLQVLVIAASQTNRIKAARLAGLGACLAVLLSVTAQSAAYAEEVYAVYFRSDRCPNCIILDPELERARSATADLPVTHLTLDLDASAPDYDRAMFALLDRGMADLYNSYLGLTGVVFLVNPHTGVPFDCLTRRETAADLAARLEMASARMQQSGAAEPSDEIGAGCPAPLRRLPDGRLLGSRG